MAVDSLRLYYRRQAERVAARRRGKLPKTPRPRRPTEIERRYLLGLQRPLRLAKEAVDTILVPQLPRLLKQTRGDHRLDDAALDIAQLIEQLQVFYQRRYSKAEAEALASRFAASVKGFTAEQIQSQFRRVLGVDALTASSAVELEVRLATAENVGLITSIPAKYFEQVQAQVWDAFRRGDSAEVLADALQERFDVAESRAALIARDQTSKLNGVLTEVTHTQLGITGYVWRTAGDARVRDTHADLDGKSFEYDSPPVVSPNGRTGNPGFDFNCRCYAEPDFKGLMDAED